MPFLKSTRRGDFSDTFIGIFEQYFLHHNRDILPPLFVVVKEMMKWSDDPSIPFICIVSLHFDVRILILLLHWGQVMNYLQKKPPYISSNPDRS